jgi:hypothetical protein
MSWLFPAGIVAGLALVAIVALHMRHRLPEVLPFPQLAFWPRVPSETRESPRWRKPPLTLLFLLQLLAALLLVLAFMRPALTGLDALGGQRTGAIHHVIVLDGSTSMLATKPEGGTRWDAARQRVDDLLGDWQEGDGLTLVVAGGQPIVRSAADGRQLDAVRDWLTGLAVPGGVPDGDAISRLLAGAALPGLDRQVTLVTDGGLAVDGPADTVTVGDGETGNAGIVRTTTSPLDNGGLLVEATVLHDRPGTETIPWVARTPDRDVASGTVTLADGASGTFEVRLPAGLTRVTLEIVSDDALPADNTAIVQPGGSGVAGMKIVLVSDVPGPLQRALEVLPGAKVEVYPTTTPGIREIASTADLVVYQAAAPSPDDMPDAPMLLVQPAGLDDAWQVSGVSPDPKLGDVALDDPALRDLSLAGITFGETPVYVLPDDATVLAAGSDGDLDVPLIWRGTLGNRSYVAWAFDPAASNIASRVTFPLLVAQTVASLAGSGGAGALAPGDIVTLPVAADAARVEVERPDNRSFTVATHVEADGSSAATFPVTSDAGVWIVSVLDRSGKEIDRGTLVVNAGDPGESRLRSASPVTFAAGDEVADGAGGSQAGDVLTEIWPLLVAAALAVIVVEWWLWLRRSLAGRRATGGQPS